MFFRGLFREDKVVKKVTSFDKIDVIAFNIISTLPLLLLIIINI